ncbi:DUF4430 domain-containing protein [Candidatus Roizmanbacteria bacterium]|nr:DUF4430 domain-containing protein [Candidatus Roizmanbacteria bacterium]
MRKIAFAAIVITLLFLGVLFTQSSSKKTEIIEATPKIAKKISVQQRIIIDEENPPALKQYEAEKGKTALDLLQRTVSVTMKGSGINAFVTSIDTREASEENKEYWAFYVNGSLANVGAGSYQLKEGDRIEWNIEKY